MEKTNAQRFIHAYNTIDQTLRCLYNFKRSMSFSDVIRRSVPVNYLVRKYEDKLVDYGRLRNAIIHKSNDEYIIAEPHSDVTIEFEHIANLIATPPKALELLEKTEVVTTTHNTSLGDVIKLMEKTKFSNIPIYRDNELIGVASGKYIVEAIGNLLKSGANIDKAIKSTTIEQVIEQNQPIYSYFEVAKASITVEEVLERFYRNHKLQIILTTKNGTSKEQPISIITSGDLIELNKVFEDYSIK